MLISQHPIPSSYRLSPQHSISYILAVSFQHIFFCLCLMFMSINLLIASTQCMCIYLSATTPQHICNNPSMCNIYALIPQHLLHIPNISLIFSDSCPRASSAPLLHFLFNLFLITNPCPISQVPSTTSTVTVLHDTVTANDLITFCFIHTTFSVNKSTDSLFLFQFQYTPHLLYSPWYSWSLLLPLFQNNLLQY